MNYFFVNIGTSYKEVVNIECLWAPIKDKSGKSIFYWDNLLKVEKNDIIFCNNGSGKIVSLCIAKDKCYDSDCPYISNEWGKEGRRIDVEIIMLKEPFKFKEIGEELYNLQRKKHGAFKKDYGANQGYLFELSKGQGELLLNCINVSSLPSETLKVLKSDFNQENEEHIEENWQYKEIYSGRIKPYTDEELLEHQETIKNKTYEEIESSSKRGKTDARIKATCLQKASFMCEISQDHKTFINATGQHQYMECHHLIPMKAQKDLRGIWLDDLFNVFSLCPGCHAQIHYGNREAKEKVFKKIYNDRKKLYENKGIDSHMMEEIFEKYYF